MSLYFDDMCLHKEYETKKENKVAELFNSIGEPMFDDPECFNTYVEKIPIGIRRKSIFYELIYWEHINIVHFLHPMHILKNVSSSLWRNIS